MAYRLKRRGPRTLPCGRPVTTAEGDEQVVGRRTFSMRPLTYDWNQSTTPPPRPYEIHNRCSSMSWSTLSNAAKRSSKISTAKFPVSSNVNMSDKTLSTAVSVEWLVLYAVWRSGSRSESFKYVTSCLLRSRSSSLEMTGKFEISRYDLTLA